MLPQKILVVGESCDDIFHYGSASRLCPDVPAPVFCTNKTVRSQGMAGNTARNLESLGASVDAIHQPEGITKVRYVEERLNYTFLRVDDGEGDITPFSVILSTLGLTDKEIARYDAVVISDYGKGFLSEQDIERLCQANSKTFIDTKKVLKDPLGDYCKGAAFVKINGPEFEAHKNRINLKEWANKLIVTLGERGCMYYTDSGFHYFPVEPVNVFDLSGAGDTFLAALVWKYLASDNIKEAIKYANLEASNVVQKRGVAVIK
jgi:D-beta-D-heptose 7-phosphate kinase/D-beta-D-heptose 1-phosphate adenosyltransferase